jgi:hypothetical protein
MSKRRLSEYERSLDGRIWQPLFLVESARKLQSGDADAVISWLDECGDELQSDIDSVRVFFPNETPAFDVAGFRQRITASIGDAAMLARLADEMLELDAAIRSTDGKLSEFIPDELFDSDASVEEMGEYALKTLAKKRQTRSGM